MTNTTAPTVSINARRMALHDRLTKIVKESVPEHVLSALSWLEATDLNLDLDDALLAMANAENVLRAVASESADPWQEYCEAFAHDANEWHGDDAVCDGPFDGERIEMARAR